MLLTRQQRHELTSKAGGHITQGHRGFGERERANLTHEIEEMRFIHRAREELIKALGICSAVHAEAGRNLVYTGSTTLAHAACGGGRSRLLR